MGGMPLKVDHDDEKDDNASSIFLQIVEQSKHYKLKTSKET
jgi:hypothetical protein